LKRALLALLLLAAAAPARAIKPPPGAAADAKRFGFNRATPIQRRGPSASSAKALHDFNSRQGATWKATFSPRTGLPDSLLGGRDDRRGATPDATARMFLAAHNDILGVDPNVLTVDRQTHGEGHRHILYRQRYNGIPVEFAAVKVHLDEAGSVIGVHSTFEPELSSVPTLPLVTAAAAGRSAATDAGTGFVRGAPSLVIVPLEADGKNHLAWKLRVDSPAGGAWRYYVDAVTGQVLFRVSVREFYAAPPPCLSSGVVTGLVYDLDPSQTPAAVRPFNDQYVYLGCQGQTPCQPSRVVTSTDTTYQPGFFCGQVSAKTVMSLQGPWVSVSQFRGPSANYNDGNGLWSTVATPIGSPHPYPNNANIVNTIDISGLAPHTVEFLPVFSDFDVGSFDGGSGEGSGDIVDDDRLMISDGAGNAIANYVGARGPFNGAAVHGSVMRLNLRSNDSGQAAGYDIAVSSFLSMASPDVDAAPLSSHTWTGADTWISQKEGHDIHGEIGLFYHLNRMHDYFTSGADISGAAPLNKPVVAMAHVGPNLLNAFYDPDYDDLSFGDESTLAPSDGFMDDATVPHHEYTHYVVQKIWDIQNYGQAGALSEANADYWSASSLDDPNIGTFVAGGTPIRQLDDQTSPSFILGSTSWSGEIHADSPFLSQAMWDVRRAEITRLGHDTGRSCADGLVFQALLYFPESFAEMYQDMLQVDHLGAVPQCGGANIAQSDITSAFAAHGLIRLGDAYEPNDGFETATDISTFNVVSATIFPAADTDFYSFGAGPGPVTITLNLPANGDGTYKDYQLKLFNVSRQQVAAAAPPANAFGTLDGFCDVADCRTTAPQVQLSYNNPTGGLLYVQVIGGDTGASNSGVNSTVPYILSVGYPQTGALSGAIVSAKFDHDTIGFAVNTASFTSNQDWRFAYAQLRNQSNWVMPNTVTHVPPLATDYLTFVSSSNAYGQISGTVQLIGGFASRFPSVGTIGLEIFGYDVHGSTSSMGVSNPLNLSDNSPGELTAYNNLFNPLLGQKATVKYSVGAAGHLTIKLYTETGRLVRTLFDGDVTAGKGSIDWAGQNLSGNPVASGIYVVRAVGPGLNTTQKIAVVK
jgi:hypothetical protein